VTSLPWVTVSRSRTHYRDLDTVTHGKLVTREFIVVLNLADVLGGIPILIY